MNSELAERSKERITPGAALQLVQKFVKDEYTARKAEADRALAEADRLAGGQTQRLDGGVVDQGRAWAMRLALISRRTAGSGYQASKGNAAVAGVVKKLYVLIGELEAVRATDVEVGLFEKVERDDFFGNSWDGINKFKLDALGDSGETIDGGIIAEALFHAVGDSIAPQVQELLAQYEIEPILVPDEPEGAKKPRRRR